MSDHCLKGDCTLAQCECVCEVCRPNVDHLAEAINRLTGERDQLRMRVAALESQVAVLEQAAIDPEAHAVYRDAAVMLTTLASGAVGDARELRDVAARVEVQLLRERVH